MSVRLVSIPRAFLARLPASDSIADDASHAEVMAAARRAWDASHTGEHLVHALGVLGDRRLMAHATNVALRFAQSRLAEIDPSDRSNAEASRALAIASAAHLLDPNDPAPELSAMGAVDVAAGALADARLVANAAQARRMFADAIRSAIDPWTQLAAAEGLVAITNEPDDLPF